ncbi:MAG: pilus assembly protein PilM [bacterium]
MTDLIEQIKKYLNYYQTHSFHEHLSPESKEIKKILLSGGGANLKGLASFLSSELRIPVDLANPWANILPKGKKEVPDLPFENSLSFATALGLALRGVKDN